MKSVLLTLAAAFSAQSFAFVSVPTASVPTQYPTDWALGMVSIACPIPHSELADLNGVEEKIQGGYLFSAVNSDGEVVYQSTAPKKTLTSTIFNGECL